MCVYTQTQNSILFLMYVCMHTDTGLKKKKTKNKGVADVGALALARGVKPPVDRRARWPQSIFILCVYRKCCLAIECVLLL